MRTASSWRFVQYENVTSVYGDLQITVQDVLARPSYPFHHLQEEEAKKQVLVLINRPAHEIGKLVIAFVKSMLFAGGYTLIVRRTICFFTQHYKFCSPTGVVGALLGGLTLFFEPAGRQSEISLYCVNKTI